MVCGQVHQVGLRIQHEHRRPYTRFGRRVDGNGMPVPGPVLRRRFRRPVPGEIDDLCGWRFMAQDHRPTIGIERESGRGHVEDGEGGINGTNQPVDLEWAAHPQELTNNKSRIPRRECLRQEDVLCSTGCAQNLLPDLHDALHFPDTTTRTLG